MSAILTPIKESPRLKLALVFAASFAAIGASIALTQRVWWENGLRPVQSINEQRLQLVVNAIKAEINRQDHLPVVLALDADVRQALATPGDRARLEQLSRKLQQISIEADTPSIYVMGLDGKVLASSDWNARDTLVGRSFVDQPYFIKAIEKGKGSQLGEQPGSNRIRYYLAEAVRDPALLGLAVVRIEFDRLEAAWEQAGEQILVTDANGVVFLASNPVYKHRTMTPSGSSLSRRSESSPALPPGGHEGPIEFTTLEQRGAASIVRVGISGEQATYLYRSVVLPEYGWTIHRLAELSAVEADQRDGAIIGGTVSALIIAFLLYVIQRHRAYVLVREAGARLKSEVEQRTRELREANASLQTEVDERRRTEAQLRATQNELVQAGKLAALGQMSAAIAHEINQPLAAIRTYLASTKKFAQRGDASQVTRNLGLINDLAERVASITGHLKTFARKSDPSRPEPFLVQRAVEGALFLLESQVKAAGVRIDTDIQPDVWVKGYPVQLEQVIVNLVRNALDAVGHVDRPRIDIRVRGTQGMASISVIDNGPGIPPDLIQRIFDPFMTTKPVGKGLGLGLSISYGIVQDFHGRIHAANHPAGGAELTIELPRLTQEATLLAGVGHA